MKSYLNKQKAMRFLKMKWVKVVGLIFIVLLPSVLIYSLTGESSTDPEKEFLSDSSKRMRWEGCGGYKDILYQRNVKWSGFQDGSGPTLDADNYIVFAKSELNVSQISDQWKLGQTLVLAYSRAEGAFLIDPNNARHLRLLSVAKNHPIDEYIEQELSGDKPGSDTTSGMVDIYSRGIDLWELELARLDSVILSGKYFKGEIRQNYIKLQKVRKAYADTQSRAQYDAIYFTQGDGGTIRRIESVCCAYKIIRSTAQNLMMMARCIDDFDSPVPEGWGK